MCMRGACLGVVRDEQREAADARDQVLQRGQRDGEAALLLSNTARQTHFSTGHGAPWGSA